jgi:hypothetical protein
VKSIGEPYPQLTLFAADTPANPSALPAFEKEKTTNDTYGQCLPNAFAWLDHDSHCWRTLQGTFLSDLDKFLQTWPRSGMTRNGIAYQLQPSAHRTYATEYLSSQHEQTWSTPTKQMVEHRWEQLEQRGNDLVRIDNNGNRWSAGLANEVRFDHGDPSTPHGLLNPNWVEWLMGFPIGWTELQDSGTQ